MKKIKDMSDDFSTKLKLVSTFKTAEDAKSAELLFNNLLKIKKNQKGDEQNSYSSEMLLFFLKTNFCIPQNDVEQLDYLPKIKAKGNIIEVRVNEWTIQPLVQVLVHFDANVNLSY